MPSRHRQAFAKFTAIAERYAAFYFDPQERARMMSYAGCSPDAAYAVLVRNHFVPVATCDNSASTLRKFVTVKQCDDQDHERLAAFLSLLDVSHKRAVRMLETEGANDAALESIRVAETWPAVGLAISEESLRELLVAQFECMRVEGVPWIAVDSSTHTWPMHGGAYTYVNWFWHR